MALADTITLENAFNAANAFAKIKQDLAGSYYLDTANSTAPEPRSLSFKNSVQGGGASAIDRHLISFSQTKLDSETIPRIAVVNLSLAVPRASVITSTIMYNLVANLCDFLMAGVFASSVTALTTTNVDKILRGEQ